MHVKHPKLERNSMGEFGRNEISIFGSPCDQIKEFALQLAAHFSQDFLCSYVDFDHDYLDPPHPSSERPQHFHYVLNDQSATWMVQSEKTSPDFQHRQLLKRTDLAVINANHPWPDKAGQRLKVLLYSDKKWKRLKEKENALQHIDLVVFSDEKPADFDDHVPTETPQYSLSDHTNWQRFLTAIVRPPELHALLLSGGESSRMGTDKGSLEYHGKPQRIHLQELLEKHCVEVHHSVRDASEHPNLKCIEDRFLGMGPFGAIASGFLHNPNKAYLVLACDLPFIDDQLIEELIAQRSSKHIATAIYNPETSWPDPLCTIWEPKSYFELMEFLALGLSCPRKVLINADTKVIKTERNEQLRNANSPEDYQRMKRELEGRKNDG